MRVLFLKDKTIPKAAFDRVWQQVRDIYDGLSIETTVRALSYDAPEGEMRYNFDSLPYGFVKRHIDEIHRKDNNRYDHIIFLVHEDNWRFQEKRVWGENFSHYFYDYHVQICRWDKDNEANSVGTLYHEIMHSHDALIERELGVKVAPLLEVNDYDDCCVHGGKNLGGCRFKYIRHKENQEVVKTLLPHLKQSYAARYRKYLFRQYDLLQTVVELMEKVLHLRRTLETKKKNTCH